ncbi:MAG: hypothetical protein H0U36_13510 [Nocardioidaceae bacterium]|nr:hypothetical protein [Nocardioidaceae bacterium]
MRRVPLLDRASDAYAATGPYGVLVRLAVLVASALSMGGAVVAGGTASPLLVVCAGLLALGTIARPDSHFGLALIAVLALHWYAADIPQPAWSLLPATAITVVHVLTAHAAIVPPRGQVQRAVVSRWAGHTAAVIAGTAAAWLLTLAFGQVHAGGLVLLTTTGVLLVLLVAVVLGVSSTAPDDA